MSDSPTVVCSYCTHDRTDHSRLSGCLATDCDCSLGPVAIVASPRAPEPVASPSYAGTSGHSGSEASRDAVIDQDIDGTAAAGRKRTLRLLGNAQAAGLTWRELAAITTWHHGRATSFLSHLHKQGQVARLLERRANCSVYVLPDLVGDRPTARHGRVGTPLARLTDDERRTYDRLGEQVDDAHRAGFQAVTLSTADARVLRAAIERLS